MKKGIAFFDFDGTITTEDTLLSFIRFTKGRASFALGFLLHAPWLLAMKLKWLPNQAVKEKVLGYFFKGTPLTLFESWCQSYSTIVLPRLIRQGALAEIKQLKKQGTIVVIVSASPENWLRLWAAEQGLELIASKLVVENGFLTGRLEGTNCYGEEKVRRIKERYQLSEYEQVYAYGDSRGDLPMLSLAHNRYYKPFRKKVIAREVTEQ